MRARKNSHQDHDSENGHFARPWVWVMIDAFLLVTAFFVSTFHVKTNENVLPQRLAAGGTTTPTNPVITDGRTVRVHVSREGDVAMYQYLSVRGTLEDLSQSLASAKSAGNVHVRVGYDTGVPFGDVISVMNACTRVGIRDVGLMPIRDKRS